MKTKMMMVDAFWSTLLGVCLAVALLFFGVALFIVAPLFIITIVSARQGFAVGVVVAILTSICLVIALLFKTQSMQWGNLLTFSIYGVLSALIGAFAKNIHRNLNNKKMSTVQLNVVVAQICSAGLMMVYKLIDNNAPLSILDCAMYAISSIVFVLALAYIKPKIILTNRSAFLTSKERSKLLND